VLPQFRAPLHQQSQHQQQQPQYRLPAKDMSNTVEYMNDEQIHANYIP
jgi:hypothetical protein